MKSDIVCGLKGERMSETGQKGGSELNVAYNMDCMEAMKQMPL